MATFGDRMAVTLFPDTPTALATVNSTI